MKNKEARLSDFLEIDAHFKRWVEDRREQKTKIAIEACHAAEAFLAGWRAHQHHFVEPNKKQTKPIKPMEQQDIQSSVTAENDAPLDCWASDGGHTSEDD
jgi:hypothetical protein